MSRCVVSDEEWRGSVERAVRAAFERSKYRRAAEAAGFVFDPPTVEFSAYLMVMCARGRFTCVCGRVEAYRIAIDGFALELAISPDHVLDPARRLHELGSFSRQHLLADGYTPAQVDEIVGKYNAALRGEQ